MAVSVILGHIKRVQHLVKTLADLFAEVDLDDLDHTRATQKTQVVLLHCVNGALETDSSVATIEQHCIRRHRKTNEAQSVHALVHLVLCLLLVNCRLFLVLSLFCLLQIVLNVGGVHNPVGQGIFDLALVGLLRALHLLDEHLLHVLFVPLGDLDASFG